MNPFLVPPRVTPSLDPEFRPAILAHRAFREAVKARPVPLRLALQRSDGSVSQQSFELLPPDHPHAAQNFFFTERLCKFLLWSRGAAAIYFDGPRELFGQIQRHYQESPTGRFDAAIMGEKIYDRPFQVVHVSAGKVPPAHEIAAPLGRHLDGCRIGFDLGASDRKAAAVIDGKPVF